VFLAAVMVLSMIALPFAFAGGAAAQDRTFDDHSNLEGSSVWQGQEVEVGGFEDAVDGEVQLRERIDEDTTRLRDELSTDGDVVEFDTENRDEGDYFLRAQDEDSTTSEPKTEPTLVRPSKLTNRISPLSSTRTKSATPATTQSLNSSLIPTVALTR